MKNSDTRSDFARPSSWLFAYCYSFGKSKRAELRYVENLKPNFLVPGLLNTSM